MLKNRMRQHSYDVKKTKNNTALCEHITTEGHNFIFTSIIWNKKKQCEE